MDEAFFEEVLTLFRHGRRRRYHLRLVGVGLTNLVPRSWQDDLFDQELPLLRELDLRLDTIREKYGVDAIRRGAALPYRWPASSNMRTSTTPRLPTRSRDRRR